MMLKRACRILGVEPTDHDLQVVAKQRYRELLKQHHPDVNNGSAYSHDTTIQLNEAFRKIESVTTNPRRLTITEYIGIIAERERSARKTKLRKPNGQFYYI